MTRLVFLCHGATAATRDGVFPADEPIERSAVRKLETLGSVVGSKSTILTSPALRARQTAEALGLAATVDPELRDCDFGCWIGQSLEAVMAADPDGLAAWLHEPDASPHGGESVTALLHRTKCWLAGRRSTPGTVLAVTHPAVIKAAVVCGLEGAAKTFWRLDVRPLSLTTLSGHAGRWTLTELSRSLRHIAGEV